MWMRQCTHTQTHRHRHTHTHTHTHLHTHMHTHTRTQTHRHRHTDTHKHRHSDTRTCTQNFTIHTNTHTHTSPATTTTSPSGDVTTHACWMSGACSVTNLSMPDGNSCVGMPLSGSSSATVPDTCTQILPLSNSLPPPSFPSFVSEAWYMPKETKYSGKRDLILKQTRPSTKAKAT